MSELFSEEQVEDALPRNWHLAGDGSVRIDVVDDYRDGSTSPYRMPNTPRRSRITP